MEFGTSLKQQTCNLQNEIIFFFSVVISSYPTNTVNGIVFVHVTKFLSD